MRCHVPNEAKGSTLPIIGMGGLAAIRKSKRSKWRAATLIGVHVLVAAHIAQYAITGRTLSPVEPSEAAYALAQGYVRAGAIFFVVALLGTMIFGRFFCGWGCHIVAVQDLCGWIMKKLGVRPRAFRSRFLAFAPLVVAFFLLAWPALRPHVFGPPSSAFPGFSSHLMTDDFWQTFPGPLITLLTLLVCGFAAVYFLGAKGFCTYGCPYGAFFGPVDYLSTGRIVVSDACEQCGHCTATCTSNVRVHEEVKLYGMVVDPGCMKCTDCVSVCPTGALRFAFGKPSLFKRAPSMPRTKRYDLPLAEEVMVAVGCLFTTLAFFRLYDGPPLLMAAGLGAITAFLVLKLWHVLRRSNVGIQNLVLKSGGKVHGGGWVFVALASVWLSFTAHSAFVQWHRTRGLYYLNRTESTRADVIGGGFLQKSYPPEHYLAALEARRHLSLAYDWGIVSVLDVTLGLTWADLLEGDLGAAEAHARSAIALAPEQQVVHQNLVDVLVAARRIPEAIEAMRGKFRAGEPSSADHFLMSWLLTTTGRFEEAAAECREVIAVAPGSAEAQSALGGLLRRLGRYDEALLHLRTALQISPDRADTEIEAGLTYLAMDAKGDALRSFKHVVALEPNAPDNIRQLIESLEGSVTAGQSPAFR